MEDIKKTLKEQGVICEDNESVARELYRIFKSTARFSGLKSLEYISKYEEDPQDMLIVEFEDGAGAQFNVTRGRAGAHLVIGLLKQIGAKNE